MSTAHPLVVAALMALAISVEACGGGGGTSTTTSANRTPRTTAALTQLPGPTSTMASPLTTPASTSAATTPPPSNLPAGQQQYRVEFTLASDPGSAQHQVQQAGPMPGTLQLTFGNGTIAIRGNLPFIAVAGPLATDGGFTASGVGLVGLTTAVVDATFEGTVLGDALSGSYTLGKNGRLPGGQPITYNVSGQIRS